MTRHLEWDGCRNVRDLGGLPAADGHETRRGALVRADAVDCLSAHGWEALEAHGVRTVVDLREPDEVGADTAPRPAGITTVHVPLDGADDDGFWSGQWANGPQFATPLYYGPHIDRFPERSARAVSAIARAEPGGVLFHCGRGRDRSGQVAMLVLALVGVADEDIAADYDLSAGRLAPHFPEECREVDEYLAGRGTTAPEVLLETLSSLDAEAQMRAGGMTDEELEALRARLLTTSG
ncbi:MAG TPA: tyrosine-protein phosphatase [Thermoleophilaceae bacterium]